MRMLCPAVKIPRAASNFSSRESACPQIRHTIDCVFIISRKPCANRMRCAMLPLRTQGRPDDGREFTPKIGDDLSFPRETLQKGGEPPGGETGSRRARHLRRRNRRLLVSRRGHSHRSQRASRHSGQVELARTHRPFFDHLHESRATPACRRHNYPFTAPDVRPATILRWKISTSTNSGNVTVTDAAMIWPNGYS